MSDGFKLQRARRDVAESEQRVAEQVERVELQRKLGRDVGVSEELLANLESGLSRKRDRLAAAELDEKKLPR